MDKQELIACRNRISPFIHNTPVLTSQMLNELTGAKLFFKCENFQRTGSFKMRGATNAIMQLSSEKKGKGVVTHSSGNFAQALAYAATRLDIISYIVMPHNASIVKKNAVKGYGAIVIECEPTITARETTAEEIEIDKGATFIHPFNNDNVIIGQATAGMELLEIQPHLEYILAPIGGGGLVSGTALSANYFGNNCRTIGAEPSEVDDAFRSMSSGKIEINKTTNTIADGLKTNLGDKTFPIIKKYVNQIVTVAEKEIVHAMRMIYERMKIIIEPSAAVAVAALLKEKKQFMNQPVGVILSGGNVDLDNMPFSKNI